jgi:predicted nucleotidyltransferase/HEPN domain-containing protein
MASKLSALPQGKQDELAFVVETIRRGFAHATERRSAERLRNAKLLKIILFGSYARGGWVEDPKGRYFSDYDILCVVNAEELTDWAEYWAKIDRTLITAEAAGRDLRTPHSIIIHTLDDVNEQLRLGRYFFIDIANDGIVLFGEDGHPFAQPHPLTPADELQEAQASFDVWDRGARNFLKLAKTAISEDMLSEAAFLLHQSAERACHCLLLVRTLYSPKTHRLSKLREMTEDLEPRLRTVWPNSNKFERRCFALINEAYVKGRYSSHYAITVDQIKWLVERVELLISLVGQASFERLAELKDAA